MYHDHHAHHSAVPVYSPSTPPATKLAGASKRITLALGTIGRNRLADVIRNHTLEPWILKRAPHHVVLIGHGGTEPAKPFFRVAVLIHELLL